MPVLSEVSQFSSWGERDEHLAAHAARSREQRGSAARAWASREGGTAYRLLAIVLRPAHGDHAAADHKGHDGQHKRRDEAKGVGDDVGGHAGQDGHEAVAPGRPREGLRQQVRVKAWPRRRRAPVCRVRVRAGPRAS